MNDQAKAISSINKRIKVRKQEVAAAKKNIAELDALLTTPELGSDQVVKIIHQKNQISNRLVKLTDEIETEEQKKNKLLSDAISSDDLKQEELQKKIKHREIQIEKLTEQLVSREEAQARMARVEAVLSDLGRKLSREYRREDEPAIAFFKAAIKKLEDV
mgnify:CR=1 FL=1